MLFSTTNLVLVASFYTSSIKSSFNYNHSNLPFEPVIVLFILTFSAPLKSYTIGRTYLVRRQLDPSDQANAWLYDDNPTRPCSHHGPFYRQCAVCLKNIPVIEIFTLHTFRHIPHYTCPPCLDFLLSRGYQKCPVCRNPHLCFRLDASISPSTILAQAKPSSLPTPRRSSPRRNIRHLNTEE